MLLTAVAHPTALLSVMLRHDATPSLCLQVTNVPAGQIDSVFNKVAGSDQKLDKAEFTLLVNQVLKKAGVTTAPVTAAPIAAPAAEAAAAAPVAAQ